MHFLLYLSTTDITNTLHNISFTLQDRLYLVCLSYFIKIFMSISKINFLKWQTGYWYKYFRVLRQACSQLPIFIPVNRLGQLPPTLSPIRSIV